MVVAALMGHVAPFAAENKPMEFTAGGGIFLCPGFAPCAWIIGEGRIEADTPERFKKFIEDWSLPDIFSVPGVVLSSPGRRSLRGGQFGPRHSRDAPEYVRGQGVLRGGP
jgi:hypothetical protein